MSDVDSDQLESADDYLEIDQGEDVSEEVDDSETESSEESQESDEGSEKVPAKKSGYVEFSPEQQARVNDITRKRHDAERRAEAAERELAKYKKPPEPPREVPAPTADPITESELYAQQQKSREQYIRAQAVYEANEQSSQQQKQAAEERRIGSLLDKYNGNIERLGISTKILSHADQILTEAGISKDVIEYLLDEDDGPAIVAHFSAHPEDAETLVRLPALKVGAFIEQKIRSQIKSKPISKAPPPPTKVSGERKSPSTGGKGYRYR